MKNRICTKLFGLLLISLALTSGSRAQVAVVVNKSLPVVSLSANTLLEIYTMNMRRWPDGTPIKVVLQKGNPDLEREFYAYLGKHPLDLRKIWMRIQLSGEGMAPKAFNTEQEVLAEVAATPGAIAFVRRSRSDSVKTVLVIDQ